VRPALGVTIGPAMIEESSCKPASPSGETAICCTAVLHDGQNPKATRAENEKTPRFCGPL
jgi:hypothetical protein